jgi:hypothetical protein
VDIFSITRYCIVLPIHPSSSIAHPIRLERPVRESAKNIAIEKGLKRAAENRNSLIRLKGTKVAKKRPTGPGEHGFSTPSAGGNGGSSSSNSISISNSSSKVIVGSADRNRSKKAYSTAKQRLGKILGLKF